MLALIPLSGAGRRKSDIAAWEPRPACLIFPLSLLRNNSNCFGVGTIFPTRTST
jgi:hypothetical protein